MLLASEALRRTEVRGVMTASSGREPTAAPAGGIPPRERARKMGRGRGGGGEWHRASQASAAVATARKERMGWQGGSDPTATAAHRATKSTRGWVGTIHRGRKIEEDRAPAEAQRERGGGKRTTGARQGEPQWGQKHAPAGGVQTPENADGVAERGRKGARISTPSPHLGG